MPKTETSSTTPPTTSSTAPSNPTPTPEAAPTGTGTLTDGAPNASSPAAGDDVAVLDTSMGRIVLKFFPDKAPKTVENYKALANKGFYNGTKFHRVISGFMIQGGDPNTKDDKKKAVWGQGDPGYKIDAELNDTAHERGILSMARSQDINSAGSQFFICHAAAPSLDGAYTAFGQVVDGMATVDKIATTPTEPGDVPKTPVVLKSVKIEKWPVK
ncbi:peptidylprolyl isomerase [bacterium]|nr:MAG: peptidylprolyl isomerase [bacterium]